MADGQELSRFIPCRHCGVGVRRQYALRHRQLCKTCYGDPFIAGLYPPRTNQGITRSLQEEDVYIPSLEEIRQACATIRKDWRAKEANTRAGTNGTKPWTVPGATEHGFHGQHR